MSPRSGREVDRPIESVADSSYRPPPTIDDVPDLVSSSDRPVLLPSRDPSLNGVSDNSQYNERFPSPLVESHHLTGGISCLELDRLLPFQWPSIAEFPVDH